ncbi:LCP family protein [Calorimonas adulescens]|uniref:LytR family transcriptional regulator n=1 Tax=Calorimonas adulescens TaxID=2606906 RepID=A0A5D8QC62_9THEO|nr:LCP family protein [Calorimonas adulescens]TZE82230.1 LytR family transcriptional regulator [Calorimonas adulescens]
MKKIIRYVAIILACLVLLVLSGAYFYLKNLNPGYGQNSENQSSSLDTPKPAKHEPVNILILGIDGINKTDKGRSDTLMLLTYNPDLKKATLISIPRDTRIKLDRYGYQKINAAYTYENEQGSMKAVSDLLDIPIHYYVKIDYQGFIKLVDDIGGVKVNVPLQMDYDDDAGNLHIHLKMGEQVLNGEQALGLVRWRKGYVDQDLGRIKTQQLFVKAFIDKLTSPAAVLNAQKILKTINEYVETNMTPSEALSYVDDALKVGKNIKMYTLPGEPKYIDGISYYVMDEEQAKELLQEVNVENNDKNSDLQNGALDAIKKYGLDPSGIKIEVLNGGAPPNSATEVGNMLKDYGFDVKRISNISGTEYSSTQIINRTDNTDIGKMLSEVIGDSVIINDPDPSLGVDVTVIVGKNYKQ